MSYEYGIGMNRRRYRLLVTSQANYTRSLTYYTVPDLVPRPFRGDGLDNFSLPILIVSIDNIMVCL